MLYAMNFLKLVILIFNVVPIENRAAPISFASAIPRSQELPLSRLSEALENMRPQHETIMALKKDLQMDSEEYFDTEKKDANERNRKSCAIVVLSSVPNTSMQSLLRKYRYDANGILIPNSVRYYVKLPQGIANMDPVLVPLNDKAFSAQGGFVRYYKEVPPIPQSW